MAHQKVRVELPELSLKAETITAVLAAVVLPQVLPAEHTHHPAAAVHQAAAVLPEVLPAEAVAEAVVAVCQGQLKTNLIL